MGDVIDRDEAIKVARSLFRLQTSGLYGAAGVGSYGLLTEIAEQAIRALPAAPAEDEAATLRDRLARMETERDELREANASYQGALTSYGIDGSEGSKQ